MSDITRNFSFKEFGCQCVACEFSDGAFIVREFVEKLQMVRDWIDEPMRINCGLRCERRNSSVGGSPISYHLKGLAADVHCTKSIFRLRLIQGALDCHLTVGIYETFIHLDMRHNQICFVGKQ